MRNIPLLPLALCAVLFACSSSNNNSGGGGGGTLTPTTYAGTWVGTWTNTTFASNGAASATVTYDANAGTFGISVDLGGGVFGGGDPPAEAFTATVGASSATLNAQTSAVYGQLTGTLNANGTLSIAGSNINVGTVRSFSATGTWSATQIVVNVTITFAQGSNPPTAAATATLTKQ